MSGHAEASLRQILAEVENTTGCGEWPQRHPDDGDAYCAGCEIGTLAQKAMMDLEDLTAAAHALVTEVDWDDLHSMARMIDALRVALGAVECPVCHDDPDYSVSVGMGAAGPCQICVGRTPACGSS